MARLRIEPQYRTAGEASQLDLESLRAAHRNSDSLGDELCLGLRSRQVQCEHILLIGRENCQTKTNKLVVADRDARQCRLACADDRKRRAMQVHDVANRGVLQSPVWIARQ